METLPNRFKIIIISKDITRGDKKNSSYCPVALTLRKQFPGLGVLVGKNATILRDTDSSIRYYKHSSRLEKFIARFDRGISMEPASFVLTRIT